jgi:hypothetical protein
VKREAEGSHESWRGCCILDEVTRGVEDDGMRSGGGGVCREAEGWTERRRGGLRGGGVGASWMKPTAGPCGPCTQLAFGRCGPCTPGAS